VKAFGLSEDQRKRLLRLRGREAGGGGRLGRMTLGEAARAVIARNQGDRSWGL
jgi:hypothetical protein